MRIILKGVYRQYARIRPTLPPLLDNSLDHLYRRHFILKIVNVVALEPSSLNNIDTSFLDVPPHHPCPQLFVRYQLL